MLKAVIYARYSSEKQNEQSIEGQIHECNEFAKSRDIVIVNNYIDRALSARTDDRPAFKKMIKDSSLGIFDAVIVYKTDRFARNRYDSALYKAKLKKNNIKIFYAKENIPDGPEGIILESMLEGFAEYYSAELSQKVKRGIKENIRKGLSFGGSCLYGYKIIDKKYTINTIQKPYLIKIFEDYAAGRRAVDILSDLNSAPDFAGKGHKWSKSSLTRMLSNKKYIGIYSSQGLTIHNAIPALISSTLFNKVQEKLLANKRRPGAGRAKANYLLSGKLFCGNCGHAITGSSGTSKTAKVYNYYRCGQKNCGRTVQKNWLEKTIVDATTNYVLVPQNFSKIAKKCIDIYKKEAANTDITTSLESQLTSINKKITNIMAAIEAGIFTVSTKDRLSSLDQQKFEIETEIKNRQAQNSLSELTEEHIIYMLQHFYKHKADADFYSKIIDGFIYKVYLYNDSIYVIYNLLDSSKQVSKADVDAARASSYINLLGDPPGT